jgi:hypothetical protein
MARECKAGETLEYHGPTARQRVPVWKHVVLVPLLFWVGLFIAAMLGVMVVGVLSMMHVIE